MFGTYKTENVSKKNWGRKQPIKSVVKFFHNIVGFQIFWKQILFVFFQRELAID